MKRQKGWLPILVLMAMVLLPATAVRAENIAMKMIVGEERKLPNTYWFSKFSTSDGSIASVDENGVVTAKKVGTAVIKQSTLNVPNVYIIQITDEADIVVAMGQSNMCGSGGSIAESPVVSEGVLQYQGGVIEPLKRQGSLLPSFGNSFYRQTKKPVILVQTARGGSSSVAWLRDGLVQDSVKQLQALKKKLEKHKVKIGHVYMIWMQGETDAKKGIDKATYMSNCRKIFKKMKSAGTQKFLMIQIGQYRNRKYNVDVIIDAQKTICKKNKDFIMVSDITKKLSNDTKWYRDDVHFNQPALNKIGAEAGKKAGKLAKK